jgi:segregation and condensation protein B
VADVARLFPVHHDGETEGPAPGALFDAIRIAEALLFASTEPLDERQIAERMPDGVRAADALEELRRHYAGRGINLVRVARKWTFRTAADLGWLLSRETKDQKKLSRPGLETLAIIAYHQPVTRAEIEDIRGVALSRGTLDMLLETGWVRLRGRRKAPGRPVTYGTTENFLLQFGLESVGDLPGLDELKAAGLFDGRLPPGFGIPQPRDDAGLMEDEDPLEDGDLFDDMPQEAEAEGADSAGGDAGESDRPG